jgi:hypothetical protein
MILKEIQNYLNENGNSVVLFEMKNTDSACIIYKSGDAHKPGARRSATVHRLAVYIRGKVFLDTYNRAMNIYKSLHFPGIYKTIETEERVVFSSECLSMPAYTGRDTGMRHLFVFDVSVKSIDKE